MKQQRKRKPIRLSGHNYNAGYYFITICTKGKQELFGKIVGTTAPGRPHVELTSIGICVEETIRIANRNNVKIDKYVIMPNHIHMIINISGEADGRGWSSLRQVVRNIKSYVTKTAGFSLWQARFHDRIIRNEDEYNRIWTYIDENPSKWIEDRYYMNQVN